MMKVDVNFHSLTQRDLSEVRKRIDPSAYKRSIGIIIFWCIFDIIFYVLSMYGIAISHNQISKLLFGILAGIATSSMFVLAHDAAHGALFKSKLTSEIIGTIYMLPSLNMYRLWCYGHNRVHHGFTSYSPLDWIWRPLTIGEYKNLSTIGKILYRIERSPYGCGMHYLLKVWWSKMVKFVPVDLERSKVFAIRLGKFISFMFALTIGVYFYKIGGAWSLIAALVVPFIVFTYVIALIVYLHHTHPDIPFFDERVEWNHTIGAVYCTTVVYTNWLIDLLTHHILIHTPHHVDIRIPFYRLKIGLKSIKQNYSQYLHEYHISWSILKHIFNKCKLYDYKNHVWYDFNSVKRVLTKSNAEIA